MPMRNPVLSSPTEPTVLGIDPGASGALAILSGREPVVFDCPTVQIKVGSKYRTRCDPNGMARLLDAVLGLRNAHAFIEKVHANPKQGVSSMFTFGEAFGLWRGILAALRIPHTMVTPQAWKKGMMRGMTTEKDSSRARAMELWPDMYEQLKRKKDDGRAEALLIAEYGRRELGL